MDVRNILKTLAKTYAFSVYGMGEFEPDVETCDADVAMQHIEGQDETMVKLYTDGRPVADLFIVMDDGEAEIYDYGSGDEELMSELDILTAED